MQHPPPHHPLIEGLHRVLFQAVGRLLTALDSGFWQAPFGHFAGILPPSAGAQAGCKFLLLSSYYSFIHFSSFQSSINPLMLALHVCTQCFGNFGIEIVESRVLVSMMRVFF